MQTTFSFIFGIIILFLGIPIGNFLAKITKEELKSGQLWFKVIIFSSLIFGFISLILEIDSLMFPLFFIAIVTSRSLVK